MTRSLPLSSVLLATTVALACGDDGGNGVGSAGSTGTGPATTGTSTEAGSTTTGTAASTGTDSAGGMGSTGGAVDGVTYSAVSIPGDPNQIQVRRKDDNEDRCTWIILTDQSVGLLAIATPDGWTPQVGLTNSNPDSCDQPDPLVGGSQEASAGMGDITAAESGTTAVPCSLDLSVELDFPQLEVVEVFDATAVPVTGC